MTKQGEILKLDVAGEKMLTRVFTPAPPNRSGNVNSGIIVV